jgi:glycosyltransferase involved in cell wall biosynthesis
MQTGRPARKRLLYVVNIASFFVSHRLAVGIAAAAAGNEVHVAGTLDKAGTRQALAAAGVTFHELHFSRAGSGAIELLRNLIELLRLFRRVRPDMVHLISIKPVLLGGVVSRVLGIKAVVFAIPGRGSVFSARGMLAAVRRGLVMLAYRLAYRPGMTRVIVQNAEDCEYFIARRIFRRQDVRLIRGSGVDLRRFAPRPERPGTSVVVFASRMIREKGVEEFVAAAREVKESGHPARFVLVGEPDPGSPGSYTVQELEAFAKSGLVEWWGFRRDMETVFAESHVVCLPTFYGEGVPKVLIEAAAAGRAIVTTDTPGCRDIVQDGHNGLLIPPRDGHRLASAIAELLADPARRRAMGENGHQRARREFDVNTVVNQTLDVYAELAGQPPRPAAS